jgi:uncharacterized membrane protein
MTKGRLEAFSDGVIAIIITIMVLELKVPEGSDLKALTADPQHLHLKFLCYVLSFVYVAIYWNNHHHMLHSLHRVDGAILWANMHLLFWLSLVPFVTGWMGERDFAPVPTALYGVVMLAAAIAYYILQRHILRSEGRQSALARAIGRDFKGKLSPVIYLVAIGAVAVSPVISALLYAGVAMIWLIPDRRIERVLLEEDRSRHVRPD